MNASVGFLTPLGALLAVGGLVPVASLIAVRTRARRVRATLGLPEPSPRFGLVVLVALLAVVTLLGLAAAQPVLERTTTRLVRSDAEVFVVVDTTRSMLARSGLDSRRRVDRAKDAAARLRDSLSGVPVGIASLTDRVLPHLFPSADEAVFHATLGRTVGVERPPPRGEFLTNATRLDALAAVTTDRFFSPGARRRLLVVLTDGESQPVDVSRFRRGGAPIVFVQLWDARERVFTGGVAEPGYRPDPSARATLERLAAATGASVFAERDLDAAEAKARELLGDGPTVSRGERRARTALAPYLAFATFLPLAFLLRRRDR